MLSQLITAYFTFINLAVVFDAPKHQDYNYFIVVTWV